MYKVKKIFNGLALAFALLGVLLFGLAFQNKGGQSAVAAPTYQEIANQSPEYLNVLPVNTTGYIEDMVYLMRGGAGESGSYVNIGIATDNDNDGLVENKITSTSQNDGDVIERNYAYIPNVNTENPYQADEYYYFTFPNNLSLYYNVTNQQLQSGSTGHVNLMQGQAISNYAKANDDAGERAFTVTGYGITPQKLDIDFYLDTTAQTTSTPDFEDNNVVLKQEGIYTLVIDVIYYYTNNGGVTFTNGTQTIYYTFMVFNSNTYFNNTTGLPNISASANIQQSALTSSDTFSRYYFYNYSFAGDSSLQVNALPTFTYNPSLYQITINYTDNSENSHTATLVYNNGQLSQVDENNAVIAEEDYFVRTSLTGGSAKIVFLDLGVYDMSFQYLYIDEQGETYELPLAEGLGSSSTLQNKNQRLYVYGYQAVYSDAVNIDPVTNQPLSVELKTFDLDELVYDNNADITSEVNNYILNNSDAVGDADAGEGTVTDPSTTARDENPTSVTHFSPSQLRNATLNYLNSNNDSQQIMPVSTNQTPIKFLTNGGLESEYSYIYRITRNAQGEYEIAGNENFSGFNQIDPGMFVYVIQYTYESYMSEAGSLQSNYYHYQIFFFEITNSTPSVTVLDSDFSEVYTSGYTNKDVYILNNAESNIFDAQVTITLSALNYNTGNYFFGSASQGVDIRNLSAYGITYRLFEMSENEGDESYNQNVGGKYGVLIDTDSQYANAFYTIRIYSNNSQTPSRRTFTIDTNEISGISARTATLSSGTNYQIGSSLASYSTNQPMVFSWNEKNSGATTYGYIKYIPMSDINYYSSQTSTSVVTQLLNRWIDQQATIPVSSKLDLAQASAWTEYRNSASYSTTIDASYVRSNAGIYILEVYDQAGNSSFEIFMLDNTSPLFVLRTLLDSGSRQIMSNNMSLSIPEEGTLMWVEWAQHKAIYLDHVDSYLGFTSYDYTFDKEVADLKLAEVLDNFFSYLSSDDVIRVDSFDFPTISAGQGQVATGIDSYNGSYLVIDISDISYIDERTGIYQQNQGIYSYQLQFVDSSGQAMEGTYNFLVRDDSNTQTTGNTESDFLYYPSAYITFKVTSDEARLTVYRGEGENLAWASYDITGRLNYYDTEDGERIYTHLDEIEGQELVQSELTYRFAYLTPVNADETLTISYIPLSSNGARLGSVTLTYYPYVKTYQEINGVYYYYYDVSYNEADAERIQIFTRDDSTSYQPGETQTFDLTSILGSGNYPDAGRYVIERQYEDDSYVDNYDYFKRTITFDVDDFGLISPLESVTSEDGQSSLESIVGGDIILSMYSGEGNSSIQVSYPNYNSNGLNSGSFYTQDSFASEDENPTFRVQGNKLPMSLYIPKYKFTTTTSYNEEDNSYSVNYNNNLSYYGNTEIRQAEDGMWHVYSEGVSVASFSTQAQAQEYMQANASILQYEIRAKVVANVIENGRAVTRYYYSNGTATNGYLNLYETDAGGNIAEGATPVSYFSNQGSYVVTLYQSSNNPQSSFFTFYKFGFEIISQEPDFEIIDASGYQLDEVSADTYYTNSNEITVQWEVPTNIFEAQINEETSVILNGISASGAYSITSGSEGNIVVADGNTRYFTIDCSSLITQANSNISITLEYQGHNDNYYHRTTKTIYFDRSAPLSNLQALMTATEQATSVLTMNYQQINMRSYQDYTGADVDITAGNIADIANMSYSFTSESGYFQYFSYNVTTSYFNTTLVETLSRASNNRYDTQYIYYEYVPSLDSYTQVDRNSFSRNNYYQLTTEGADDLQCGYYEVIEMDYAGNMTVYLVYVTDSSYEDDENVSDVALVYTNGMREDPVTVYTSEITNGYNIYSNSGFELQSIGYMSDPWSMIYIQIAGQSAVRYMASPWLDDGYVYRITVNSQAINFEQVALSSIFENVESGSQKHTLTFTDRISGRSLATYLSIMDANITTQKVEDPNRTSAILNISVPTPAQVASTTTSYVFPTEITISLYNSVTGDYEVQMVARQLSYGVWTPDAEYESALSYISFTTINNGATLQIIINLGANASQKVRFDIVDNFGNTTSIIQLANEVAYSEISGNSAIYNFTESNGDETYLSSDTIRFSYNNLLYSVEVFNSDNEDITDSLTTLDLGNNIYAYDFAPTTANVWNDYYRVDVYDSETGDYIRTVHLRIYYQLPYLVTTIGELSNGGIIFLDRNAQAFSSNDFASIPNYSVNFNGRTYTTTAQAVTTYSQNVRIRFRNGQDLARTGSFAYLDGYGYSVYLSSDNGASWVNINSDNSQDAGYLISGSGEYIIFIKYDSEDVFTNLCKVFTLSILDSSTSYYYITVDGAPIEQSDMVYTTSEGVEYHVTYLVSVDYNEKGQRLQVVANEEIGVVIGRPTLVQTPSNVYVELYHYDSEESRGDFAIIYIAQTSNILSELTYQTTSGDTTSIRSSSSVVIVANNETESAFDRLRLNFSRYYGIEENLINVEVLKYFNGSYQQITPNVYGSGDISYIYLEKSGSYRVRLYDSCSPANVHAFPGGNYIDIVFLNSVPFIISYTDTVTGETVVSERVNNAVYNSSVTLSLYNLSSYYQASGYPSISVRLNGASYSPTVSNYTYTFSRPGYYSVVFTATSTTGIPIRQEEYNFTIINENESRYAYEFSGYRNYYIESVVKDGVDITGDLIAIGNFSTVRVDGREYLSQLMMNYLDEKTGSGRYQITINTNDKTYAQTSSNSFTFEFWLNMQTPPLNISLAEGDSTSGNITINFNVQNFYNAMGDCYIRIGSDYYYFTSDRLSSYGENYTITISETGNYFIQVYTMSNNLLYSYRVERTEPLNVFAIIAIVIGVAVVVVVVIITIKLRKRQRVK